MHRLTALFMFVLGYLVMASLDASVAAAPALVAFSIGGWALVRPVLEPSRQR